MKVFPLVYFLFIAVVSAEVPSLINYQGRLTNADGEPLTGTKNFELKIFDAATDGALLYTETFDSVTLGEGGVYNFLFGEAGTSNAQVTETVGNGNGENLYQKILSNENIVDGTISVTDGTYTWSQESGSSNEDDFSASYSKNLKRITVNYFAGAPDDGRDITVTYRHQKTGITGALTGGAEQWMELTVDGETQATRQRIGAVPFALAAGSVKEIPRRKAGKVIFMGRRPLSGVGAEVFGYFNLRLDGHRYAISIPERAKKLIGARVLLNRNVANSNTQAGGIKITIDTTESSVDDRDIITLKEFQKLVTPNDPQNVYVEYFIPINFELEEGVYYELGIDKAGLSINFKAPLVLEYEY